jgi:hypothetical protein
LTCLAANVTDIDPHAPEVVTGAEVVLNIITRFRQFAPDAQVKPLQLVQAHHDVGRIGHEIWRGDDLFPTGKISWVAGFLD